MNVSFCPYRIVLLAWFQMYVVILVMLILQEELNILPINKKILDIQPINASIAEEDAAETPSQRALKEYLQRIDSELDEKNKDQSVKSAAIANSQVLRNLTALCKTKDQATAVYSMLDIITEKTRQTTVSVTASRGRVVVLIDSS